MSSELTILALYSLFIALILILKVSGATGQLGMSYLLSSRDDHRTLTGITARLDRALANSVTAMSLFAPAVLVLHAKAGFSPSSLTAAQVFLVARVLYVPAYGFGITGIRTALWLAGFAATVVLGLLAALAH